MNDNNCKWCGKRGDIKDGVGVVCAKCWLNGKQVKEKKHAKHR